MHHGDAQAEKVFLKHSLQGWEDAHWVQNTRCANVKT